jgi:aquaporin Z
MRKEYVVEALGTMVLVLMGCGAAVLNGGAVSVAAVLTIAFAFGLSVVAMAYTIGDISGCHINPAITFGVWISGRMTGKRAAGYMVSQVIGAIVGSGILYVITNGMGLAGTGANGYGEGMMWPALVAEFVFTFIFVLVVLGSTAGSSTAPKFAGLVIGLTLVLVHIVCIPVTGTSVNPARSIASALFAGGEAISQLWLFVVAPMAGGAIAALVWRCISGKN